MKVSPDAVTIPLAKRLFFQAFRSGIATASGDTFITQKIFARTPRHENTLAESHESLNPGTQNIENLGNSAKTLRLIFRALDLKMSRAQLHRTPPFDSVSSAAKRPVYRQSLIPPIYPWPTTSAPWRLCVKPLSSLRLSVSAVQSAGSVPAGSRPARPAWNSRGSNRARLPQRQSSAGR